MWRLEEIFNFFQQSGKAHSYALANNTVARANEAISLINDFPSENSQVVESAINTAIADLVKAREKANEYMEGWDNSTNTNPSFTPSYFLTPGYSALEYFLQIVRGNYT